MYQEKIGEHKIVIFEDSDFPLSLEKKTEKLWQSANTYQESRISGAGYLLITLGILRDLPKCVAVKKWILSVLTLYYDRERQIINDPGIKIDTDFSSIGDIPYTIEEIVKEVGE